MDVDESNPVRFPIDSVSFFSFFFKILQRFFNRLQGPSKLNAAQFQKNKQTKTTKQTKERQ